MGLANLAVVWDGSTVIISYRHRYVYLVVPKSASTTLRHCLAPHTDIGYPKTAYADPTHQHMTMPRFLKTEHAPLLENYFAFTFVRNPYDRLYSGYLQDRQAWRSQPEWTVAKMEIFERIGDDFNSYLLDYAARADIRTDWRWVTFCPMTEFACDTDGENHLDWFGRAEFFSTDLKTLSQKIGVEIEKAGDRNVKTPIGDGLKYLHHYSPEAIAFVNDTYRHDFEMFGYEMVKP